MNFKKTDSVFVRLVLVECIVALIVLLLIHWYPAVSGTFVGLFLLFSIGFLIGRGIRALGNALDEDINHFDGMS